MRLEELERELRAERPEVDPDFASRLDEWAARGFPGGGELDPRRSPRARGPLRMPGGLRRAWRRLRAVPPRRILGPASAAATLVIVVVAVSQIDSGVDHGGEGSSGVTAISEEADREQLPEAAGASGERLRRDGDAAGERQGGFLEGGFLDNDDSSGLNLGGRQRKQAQTISLSLATPPEDFRAAADGVLTVVGNHNGFVINSSVSGGDPDVEGSQLGEASFQLRIPANQLQPALGELSDLGHLVSRTDGTQDITSRFESAQERIETYSTARDRLLRELEGATTEAEQESVQRRLRIVERRLESARDDLARAQQRVRLVPVTVTVAADDSIRDTGGWGVGDALDDAGEILRVALGVALISAAVLLPIALIALIALIASRLVARQRRERTLDEL